MAQLAEKAAKEEVERVKLEIQTERAHVRAARDIEKHKQEQSLETKWNEFRKGTEDVNKQLDSLLEAFGQLSNVNVTVAGKSFGKIFPAGTVVHNLNCVSHSQTSIGTIKGHSRGRGISEM